MKYIIDKNVLSNDILNNVSQRKDLCVTEDVIIEAGISEQDIERLKRAGLQVLKFEIEHMLKLKEVMSVVGDNQKLINLYSGKGTADVAILAFILAEREKSTLFPEEFTVITNDDELMSTALAFNIPSARSI